MFLSRAWKAYGELLLSHPVKTKAATSTTLFAGGDVLSQLIEYNLSDKDQKNEKNEKNEKKSFSSCYDYKRSMRMGTIGVFLGPWLHHWYNFLGKVVPQNAQVLTKVPIIGKFGAENRVVVKQVMLDQLICAPIATSAIFCTLGLLEGKDMEEIRKALPTQLTQGLITNYTIWPPAMFLNFRYVPLEKRVLVANGVGLVYNTCLSFIAHAN